MANQQVQRIKTISEYHRLRGLPKPEHSLISVINLETIGHTSDKKSIGLILDFYSIAGPERF